MKNSQKIVIVCLAIVLALIILSLVLTYKNTFNSNEFSSNSADWSNFGGYFAGILGPTIAILNLGILIWLTLMVGQIQNKSEENNRKTQKMIAFATMKQDAYRDMIKRLNQLEKLFHIQIDVREVLNEAKEFKVYLMQYVENYNYLFDFETNRECWRNLMKEIDELISVFEESQVEKDFKDAAKTYLEKQSAFIIDLQKRIADSFASESS